MAVPNSDAYVLYQADGTATVFALPFKLLKADDLAVELNGSAVTYGYSVSGIGNNSATVTFSAAPAGELLLMRDIPFERLTDYQTNGDLLAKTVNNDFDRLWCALQDLLRGYGRALVRPFFRNYYDAQGYRISNVGDPVEQYDAANRGWVDRFVASIISRIQGPANVAGNVFIQAADGTSRTVQDLSATDGAKIVGFRSMGRTLYDKASEAVSIADLGARTTSNDNQGQIAAAIDEAGVRGTLFVPKGSFKSSVIPSNALGVSFSGPGALLVPAQVPADGYRQLNTYANNNPVGIGREYLNRCFQYFGLGQGSAAGTLRINLYGDSTVIGGNGETSPFNPANYIARVFDSKGIPNIVVNNRGIGGSQISAHVSQAVADLSANPGPALYILKSFINEGTLPLETRFAQTQSQLENFLSSVRANANGGLERLSIIVMGPNSTNNTRYQRDAFWYEQLRGMIVATCRKYSAAYFDTYAMLQDTLLASSIGYMDQPYPDRPLDAVHPLNAMNAQIWGGLLDWAFPTESLVVYRTNNFSNNGNQTLSFFNTTAPGDYPLGVHIYRAPSGSGAPADGFVRVTKNVDGGVLQELFTFANNDTRILKRTANLASNSWNPWAGQVMGPGSLTFQNGWADYNDGNVVTSASFVLRDDGFVEMSGMIKGGTITDGTVVAVLPVGFRPLNPENGISYSGAGVAAWSVLPNGNIVGAKGLSAGGTSLAGIKFRRGN